MKYEKNEIVTVTIEDIGSEGEGIGRVDGTEMCLAQTVRRMPVAVLFL